MKKLVTVAIAAALLLGSVGVANAAARSWDDLSWWGNSGATPSPVKDAERSGYWWWPTEPASNAGDTELWGNRGVVYAMYSPATPPPPAPPVVTPPPAPPAPPTPTRSTPVFNNVLFDFDRSTVKPEGRVEIGKVADQLKQNANDTITVEGHTDNVNRSGDPQYNVKLGQRRADAVKAVLVENGIDASRITTVSKGESEPAVPNDTAANRALNRRVVFKYSIR
jgi:outer membrane protein OmpA-like peptidoglycan-associated protein